MVIIRSSCAHGPSNRRIPSGNAPSCCAASDAIDHALLCRVTRLCVRGLDASLCRFLWRRSRSSRCSSSCHSRALSASRLTRRPAASSPRHRRGIAKEHPDRQMHKQSLSQPKKRCVSLFVAPIVRECALQGFDMDVVRSGGELIRGTPATASLQWHAAGAADHVAALFDSTVGSGWRCLAGAMGTSGYSARPGSVSQALPKCSSSARTSTNQIRACCAPPPPPSVPFPSLPLPLGCKDAWTHGHTLCTVPRTQISRGLTVPKPTKAIWCNMTCAHARCVHELRPLQCFSILTHCNAHSTTSNAQRAARTCDRYRDAHNCAEAEKCVPKQVCVERTSVYARELAPAHMCS